jgi:hypothetical protein
MGEAWERGEEGAAVGGGCRWGLEGEGMGRRVRAGGGAGTEGGLARGVSRRHGGWDRAPL